MSSNDGVLLYASTKTQTPNSVDYQWASYNDGLFKKSISITDATPTTYYVGVYGYYQNLNFASGNVSFSIVVSTEFDYLDDGYSTTESVDRGSYRYFKMSVRSGTQYLMVGVTLLRGACELYVNSNSSLPNNTNHMWASKASQNALYITSNDPNWELGEWSFAVYGRIDSTFYISVQTSYGYLQQGYPRIGTTSTTTPIYYQINPLVTLNLFAIVKTFDRSCVELYGSQDATFPSSSNYKWKQTSKDNKIGQVMMRIPKAELTDGNLYFTVIACNTSSALLADSSSSSFAVNPNPLQLVQNSPNHQPSFRHLFEINVAAENDPMMLTNDYVTVYETGTYKPNAWFLFYSGNYARSLRLYLDSCEQSVGLVDSAMFVSNSSAQFPIIRANAKYVSVSTSPFTARINAPPIPNDLLKISIDFKGTNTIFSLYGSTQNTDPRPNCSSIQFFNTDEAANGYRAYSVEVYPIASDFYPLQIQFVGISTDDPVTTNARTVCSLRMNGNILSQTVVNSPQILKSKIQVPADKSYLMNIIITDSLGRQSSCRSSTFLSIPVFAIGYSVGGILMLIVILIFILYFVIGMIFKKLRYKASRLDLIPNLGFWQDLPFLVGDGILFLFTCGRVKFSLSRGRQSKLATEENAMIIDDSASINPFDKSSKVAEFGDSYKQIQ